MCDTVGQNLPVIKTAQQTRHRFIYRHIQETVELQYRWYVPCNKWMMRTTRCSFINMSSFVPRYQSRYVSTVLRISMRTISIACMNHCGASNMCRAINTRYSFRHWALLWIIITYSRSSEPLLHAESQWRIYAFLYRYKTNFWCSGNAQSVCYAIGMELGSNPRCGQIICARINFLDLGKGFDGECWWHINGTEAQLLLNWMCSCGLYAGLYSGLGGSRSGWFNS